MSEVRNRIDSVGIVADPTTKINMHKGISRVADLVSTTLGPYGRNVAIMDYNGNTLPLFTDDGVRVIEHAVGVLPTSELLGARLVHMSSRKTEQDVGDGTTTTFLVASKMIDEYMKTENESTDKYNKVLLRRYIQEISENLIDTHLPKYKIDVTTESELVNVATISSGSSRIGKLIGELRHTLGPDGLVRIRESVDKRDRVTYTNGYEFTGGLTNQPFYTDGPYLDIDEPLVLIIDRKVLLVDDATAIIDAYGRKCNQLGVAVGSVPMVLLTQGVSGDAFKTFVHNMYRRQDKKSIPIIPIDVPLMQGGSSLMEDIGVVSNAKVIRSSDIEGKLSVGSILESIGTGVFSIRTSSKETHIVPKEDRKSSIEELVSQLRDRQRGLTTTDTRNEYADLESRISKLNGQSCIIELGGATEVEVQERRLKYDDAVLSTHSAQRDGISIGGGFTYLRLARDLSVEATNKLNTSEMSLEESLAYSILINSLEYPVERLYINSGHGDESTERLNSYLTYVKNSDYGDKLPGIDLRTGTIDLDLYSKSPVYDPYKLIQSVIENAVSAASLFISTDNSVIVISK